MFEEISENIQNITLHYACFLSDVARGGHHWTEIRCWMKKTKLTPPRFEPEYSLDILATHFRYAILARTARASFVTRQYHSPYTERLEPVFRFRTTQGVLVGDISLFGSRHTSQGQTLFNPRTDQERDSYLLTLLEEVLAATGRSSGHLRWRSWVCRASPPKATTQALSRKAKLCWRVPLIISDSLDVKTLNGSWSTIAWDWAARLGQTNRW